MNDPLAHEIVARFHGGASMRRIAQSLRISRRTVRRVLEQVEQARTVGTTQGLPQPVHAAAASSTPTRRRSLTCWRAIPTSRSDRVFEELRRLGYKGGYTILCERVRALRPRPVVAPVRRFETGPGVQAQMDYSTYDLDFTDEGRRRVYAFSYVLGYSRRQYLHFVETQDFATTIREHIRAFEHLGGVAATCLYDNMKVVVSGYDGDEPVYNPRFLAFAAHYGFRPVACRLGGPRRRGKWSGRSAMSNRACLGGRTFRVPGASERDDGLVAGRGRRRAHPSPDQGAAGGSPRRGTAPPAAAAGTAVRRLRGRLPDRRRRGVRGLPAELLLVALAADRPEPCAVRVTENELTIYDPSFVVAAGHPLFPARYGGRAQSSARTMSRPVMRSADPNS